MKKDLNSDLQKYLEPVFERKPAAVTALDISELTSYTDAIVIIEATSGRQVTSMAEHIVKRLKSDNIRILGSEGIKEGEWALLDYGDIIIHIFEPETKNLYDLEGFWSDAPRIDLSGYDHLMDKETGNDF